MNPTEEQVEAVATYLSESEDTGSLETARRALEIAAEVGPQLEYEYGWAGDAQATTFYATREEAEEFMGNPRQFRRVKAGDWEEVDPDLITKDDVGPVTYTSQEAKPVDGDPSFGQRITTHKAEPQHGQNGYATGNGYGHG